MYGKRNSTASSTVRETTGTYIPPIADDAHKPRSPSTYKYDADDLLAIPPFLDRRHETYVRPSTNIRRQIVMPKGMSDRRKKQLANKLKHLGYPASEIANMHTDQKLKAIEARVPYRDPYELVRELDTKVEQVVDIQKKVK